MMTLRQENEFQIRISAYADGRLYAAYIYVQSARVDRTEVVIEGTMMADYGDLVGLTGIELLGPVSRDDLLDLIEVERREAFAAFLRSVMPQEFLLID